MAHLTLAEVVGVEGKRIRWERPVFFFAALTVGSLVWLVLTPSWISWGGVTRFEMFNFPSAPVWGVYLSLGLFLVGIAVPVFRWVTNTAVSVVVVSALFGMASCAIVFLLRVARDPHFWNLRVLFSNTLWAGIFLGSLALALRWIKATWLALVAGAAAATFITYGYRYLWNLRSGAGVGPSARYLPFALLEMLLVAGVLWTGLWLGKDQPEMDSEEKARLRKGFFLATIAATWGLFILAVTIYAGAVVWKPRGASSVLVFVGMTSLLLIYGMVVMAVLVYRMWLSIQDGKVRTTPGQAAGYLFIPFFNFYWVFQAFPGFAADFNSYVARHSLELPMLPRGLFVAYAILVLVAAVIPLLGILAALANIFVMLAMVSRICDGVNLIPKATPSIGPRMAA